MYLKSFIFIFLLIVVGQLSAQHCVIEVYLVKDSEAARKNDFSPTLAYLEATPLIAHNEIVSYQYQKRKAPEKSRKVTGTGFHHIETNIDFASRVPNQQLQAKGPRKFVLLVDKQIIYWGYLTSTLSSVVAEAKVQAQVYDRRMDLSWYSTKAAAPEDPRKDKRLFKCLREQGRLKVYKPGKQPKVD
jgi:hypothetical protein